MAASKATKADLEIDLPKLPYAYDALEPHIDTATMQVHHGKHHLAYTTKATGAINAMLKSEAASLIPSDLAVKEAAVPLMRHLLTILSKIPKEYQGIIRNHGGGYLNHIDFWASMTPDPASRVVPKKLGDALTSTFGSVDAFHAEFLKTALGVFGSGWVWLMCDSAGRLSIRTTGNQDRADIEGADADLSVLIALDVWEHSYYLKFKNNREEYVKAFFQVINWANAGAAYDNSLSKSKY